MAQAPQPALAPARPLELSAACLPPARVAVYHPKQVEDRRRASKAEHHLRGEIWAI